MNVGEEVDLEDYVNRPEKISAADLSAICAEAGLQAVRENRYVVLSKVSFGLTPLSPATRRLPPGPLRFFTPPAYAANHPTPFPAATALPPSPPPLPSPSAGLRHCVQEAHQEERQGVCVLFLSPLPYTVFYPCNEAVGVGREEQSNESE